MRISMLSAAVVLSAALSAQTSIFVPDNNAATGTNNVIPFGNTKTSTSWSNQIYQMLIPSSFAGGQPRVIHDLGFAPSSTNLHNFDQLRIRMAVTSSSTLSTTFATNMGTTPVTVLNVRNYTWRLTADTWTRIGLSRPFTWVPQLGNLVIEVLAVGTGSATSASTGGFHRSTTIERAYAVGWTGTPPATGTAASMAATKVELVLDDPATDIFGESCAGSSGTPTLSYGNLPKLGNVLDINLANGPGNGVAIHFIGFDISAPILPIDLTPAGAPGCHLYVSPDVVLTAPMTGGTALVKIPIPNVPNFVGIRFWNQYVLLDQAANQLGVTLTEFGRALLGS